MGYPRARLVDATRSGYYHCISRCVRRAFLCGDQYDHRRQWLEDRLAELLDVFAIDACGYAIMSNHLHLILKTNPDAAKQWSPLEVARRWVRLFPQGLIRAKEDATNDRARAGIEQEYLNALAANTAWIKRWRARFASLSWFNKLLKEPIAKRANREDDCTGHFWEGRFKSIRLLDPAAILACMVYVDLNPLRAKVVQALGDSAFTSILQRLKVLRRKSRPHRRSGSVRRPRTRVSLLAIDALFPLTTREYVSLVASTGGVPVDQRDHRPSLVSLGIEPEHWATTIRSTIQWFGTAIGSTAELLNEATRRKTRRVVNPLKIYRE
jgi:REP element-mobilizing transposase RayT